MIRLDFRVIVICLFLGACGAGVEERPPAQSPRQAHDETAEPAKQPTVIEMAERSFESGAVLEGRVTPSGDYMVEWRDSAGTLARVATASAFAIRLDHPRFASNEIVVLGGGKTEARRRFIIDVSRFTRRDYLRVFDPQGLPAGDPGGFPAEGLLWRPGDPVPPPDDERPVLVDLGLERSNVAGNDRRCLREVDIAGIAAQTASDAVTSLGAHRVFAVSLGRDLPAGCGQTPFDICSSPGCARDFRRFVQLKYAGGLDAVSAAWGRPLAGWEDVRPEAFSERARGFAAWNDYMEFRDHSLAEFIKFAADAVRKAAPGAQVGFFGMGIPTAHGGADFREFARAIDWRGGRLLPGFDRLMAEHLPPGRALFSTGMPDPSSALWAAFGRGAFVQVFTSAEREAAAACAPLVGGLGRALGESSAPRASGGDSPRSAKVAVVYSPRSVRASMVSDARAANIRDDPARRPEDTSFARVFEAWGRLLEDLGVPWVPVYEDDVASGTLDPARFRVAILARTLSLSEGALAALARFAESGGVVLADGGAGYFDEGLRMGGRRNVREVFGIEYGDARFSEIGGRRRPVANEPFRFAVAQGSDSWFSGLQVSGAGPAVAGFTLAGARAEAAFGEVPCLIVNRLGGGWVVTLNLSMSAYLERSGSSLKRLIDESLRRAGVRPSAEMPHDLSWPPPAAAPRVLDEIDLVAVFGRAKSLRLFLPERLGSLHRLLPDQSPLGWTSAAEIDLAEFGFAAFALLPYRLTAIDLQSTGAAGRAELFAVELLTASEGPFQRHMLDVRVERPDGRPAPEFSRTVTAYGGRAEFAIPFALSDPPGLWTVRVRDALSGTRAIRRILRQ